MRIESDIKLGFKDVLIRPKRSTLKSRSQVEVTRTFRFYHTNKEWSGVPVIAANMDSWYFFHGQGARGKKCSDSDTQTLHARAVAKNLWRGAMKKHPKT